MGLDATTSELPQWRRYLAYATVAAMPISINVEKLVGAKSPVFFSPFEVMLPVLALLMVLDLVQHKPWARFRFPPVPTTIYAALTLFSILWAHSGAGWLPGKEALAPWAKGLINPLLFGVIAIWVFQNLAASTAEMRRLVLVLGASSSVCVLIALKQYVGPTGTPFDPDNPTRDLGGVSNVRLAGWYEIRGIFGAQMAMIIPAATAFALLDKDVAVRCGAAALAVVGLCVTMSSGGFFAACAGIVAVATIIGVERGFLTAATVLAILAGVSVVILPRLPRQNVAVLMRGVALYADDPTDNADVQKPTARARRVQAEFNALAAPVDFQKEHSPSRWLKGYGVGNYQSAVNSGYTAPYMKPMRRTDEESAYDMEADERFTFGFLETVTIELGIGGLLIALLVLGSWVFSANGAFSRHTEAGNDDSSELALASFGAGIGASILSIFGNPLIRGVGGTFALFFAIALCTRFWARNNRI